MMEPIFWVILVSVFMYMFGLLYQINLLIKNQHKRMLHKLTSLKAEMLLVRVHYELDCIDGAKYCAGLDSVVRIIDAEIKRLEEDKMTKQELFRYVKNKECLCSLCAMLKEDVLTNGVEAIKEYQGMQCAGVEDMKHKYHKLTEE